MLGRRCIGLYTGGLSSEHPHASCRHPSYPTNDIGSCNEIGQGTLSARSRRGERTSRSTLVPKNNGVFEPNNDPNQKDSILKSGQEVTNEGEHDIYGRYALGRYGSKLLHSTYRIGDEDNTHGTKWESISDDPYDLVLLTQGEVLEG